MAYACTCAGKNGTPMFYLSAGGEGQQEVACHSTRNLQTLLIPQRQHLQHWPPHLHIHDGRAEQLGGARETVETSGGQERERESKRGEQYHPITKPPTMLPFTFSPSPFPPTSIYHTTSA